MEDFNLLLSACRAMDKISSIYCEKTICNDSRMKSVEALGNCYWYHGGWMYCRLSGIIVSNDYCGDLYSSFFGRKQKQNRINILICGLADFAILDHILSRIPKSIENRVFITVVDICESPLQLCDWFIHQPLNDYLHFADQIKYVKANAINLPFDNSTFDLITNYSFLTRMNITEMEKVVNEWTRVLKTDGEIFTTIRINSDDTLTSGEFYRSKNNDMETALQKVDDTIHRLSLSTNEAVFMKIRVKKYLDNIMSVAIPSIDIIKRLFYQYKLFFSFEDQQGELESIHRMIILRAIKHNEE